MCRFICDPDSALPEHASPLQAAWVQFVSKVSVRPPDGIMGNGGPPRSTPSPLTIGAVWPLLEKKLNFFTFVTFSQI